MTDDIAELIERLRTVPTIILPNLGPATIKVTAGIRQLMIDRQDAADALVRLSARVKDLEYELEAGP